MRSKITKPILPLVILASMLPLQAQEPAKKVQENPNQPEWWIKPGNVHYNDAGKNAQGDEVARIIREALLNK